MQPVGRPKRPPNMVGEGNCEIRGNLPQSAAYRLDDPPAPALAGSTDRAGRAALGQEGPPRQGTHG